MNDSVQLTITVLSTGEVQVAGPIHNKPFCYSTLLMAFEALMKFYSNSKDAGPAIALAKEMPRVG